MFERQNRFAFCVAVFLSQVAFSNLAWGQQESAQPELADEVAVMEMEVRETTELPPAEVIEVKYDLKAIEFPKSTENSDGLALPSRSDSVLNTDGIVAQGYTRSVDVGSGKRIGQVMINRLEKDGQSVYLDYTEATDQFEMKETRLNQSQPVTVTANRVVLVNAIKKLNEQIEAATASDSEVSGQGGEEDSDRFVKSEEKSSGLGNFTGSQTADTGTDRDYGAYELDKQEEVVPSEYEVVSDGCQIVVDTDKGVAIQQTRLIEIKAGDRIESSGCTDSDIKYDIEQDYYACETEIDFEVMKVRETFKEFYTDGNGAVVTVNNCGVDPDRVFDIVEMDGCLIRLDQDAGKAYPQVKLSYTDQGGGIHIVRDCADSEDQRAVDYYETPLGCSVVDSFEDGVSRQYVSWLYELNNQTFAGTQCIESEDSKYIYPHFEAYKDNAGHDVCSSKFLNGGQDYLSYYRLAIEVDGNRKYLTECRPDEQGTVAVLSTTEGCEDLSTWRHDLDGGVSYGQHKTYVVPDGRTRKWLTESCVESGREYEHSVAITSWMDKPDQLAAYALLTVTINGPNGPYVVTEDYLPQGSPLVPYVYKTSRKDLLDQEINGCNVRNIFQNVKVYTRPDDKFFEVNHGESFADYAGWKNKCKETRLDRREIHYSSCCGQRIGDSGGVGTYSTALVTFREIDKIERRNTVSKKVVKVFCRLTGKETKRTVSYGASHGSNKGTLSQVLGHSSYRGNPASSCPF